MRRIRAALTLALALTGCVGERAAYTAAVAHAEARWEAACGVRPEPSAVYLIDAARFYCGRASPNAVGCTDDRGRVWFALYSTAPIEGVVLHEMGHVLGAGHLPTGVPGVMQPTIQSDQWRPCLTQADLDAVGTCVVDRPECN